MVDRVVLHLGIVRPGVETKASATIDAPPNHARTATEFFMMRISSIARFFFPSFFEVLDVQIVCTFFTMSLKLYLSPTCEMLDESFSVSVVGRDG